MIRMPVWMLVSACIFGVLHATELPKPARALCTAVSGMAFKASDAPRQPDDVLLRTVLKTDDPATIRQAITGKNVNALRGTTKTTPLALAASSGNLGAIKVLPDAGAHADAPSASGMTPMEATIISGQAASVCLLLERGGDLHTLAKKTYLLPAAALTEDFQAGTVLVGILIRHDYDSNAKTNGDTALHIAAELGNKSLVNLLLNSGARLDIPNHRGETPHAVAKRAGNTEIMRMLESAKMTGAGAERTTFKE